MIQKTLVFAQADADKLPLPDAGTFGTEGYQYLAKMTQQYSRVDPTFKPVDALAIQQCTEFWRANVAWDYARAGFLAANKNTRDFIAATLKHYVGANGNDVAKFAQRQANCAAEGVCAGRQTNDLDSCHRSRSRSRSHSRRLVAGAHSASVSARRQSLQWRQVQRIKILKKQRKEANESE